MMDDIPLSGEQLSVLGFALLLVGSAVMAPGLLPAGDSPTDAKTGTYTTPEPVQQEQRGQVTAVEANYDALPDSHERGEDVEAPGQVSASAGAQTMDITARQIDGQPGLVLSDSRVHEGRWVSVEKEWFEREVGEVPDAAHIRHESGDTYTTPTHERDGSVAFYVEEFSTNTVTFSGEVSISGNPAADGSSYSYTLTDVDSVSDYQINVTGEEAKEWDNETATFTGGGGTMSVSPAGTRIDGPSANDDAVMEISASRIGGNYLNFAFEFSGTSNTEDHGLIFKPEKDMTHVTAHISSDNGGVSRAMLTDRDGNVLKGPISASAGDRVTFEYDFEQGQEYAISVDDDGGEFSNHYDSDFDGETTTNSDVTVTAGHIGYSESGGPQIFDEITMTSRPGDVSATADTGQSADFGTMTDGETQSEELPVSPSTTSVDVAADGGDISTTLRMEEVSETVDPTVEVNGQTTDHLGTLEDGSTETLTTDTSWVHSGENTVNVSVGDGTLSDDAPTPKVGLSYSHTAADNISTDYTETQWTEQYNVSRSYSSDQSNATLTVPFQTDVLEIDNLEMRTNGGAWSTVDAADYSMDGTELTVEIGSVAAGDEVAVRTTGIQANAVNGEITVLTPTQQGNDLDTEIQIDSWSADARIEVPERGSYHDIHYAHNASWADLSDSARIEATGGQDVRMPNATAGGKVNIATIPVEAEPVNGDVVVEVTSASDTQPEWEVSPGQSQGNDVDYTFIDAEDGVSYSLYSESEGIVRDQGTAESPLTLTDDDSIETLTFLAEESGASSGGGDGGGSGILSASTPSDGNILTLTGVGLAIGALLVISRRDDAVTAAGEDAAGTVRSATGGIPVLGPALGGVLGGLIQGSAQAVRVVLGNQTIAVSVAMAIALAAIQAGVVVLPAGSLVIAATAAIAGLSFVGLREFDEFTTTRWAAIVVATTLVALQTLSDESLLTAIVNSQVFPILAAGGLYLAYQAISAFRQGQTQNIVIETDGGNNE